MKKHVLSIFISLFCIGCISAQVINKNVQSHRDILACVINSSESTNGIKIKTNIPFETSLNGVGMPIVRLHGWSWAQQSEIDLDIAWYSYNNSWVGSSVTTSGSLNPDVWLAVEDGKVVIYLDHKNKYLHFIVSAYSWGFNSMDRESNYQNWTVVNEAITGTRAIKVEYKDNIRAAAATFKSKVGIGTESPRELLDVNGTIRAKEVKIEATNWPDYVFSQDYKLPTLKDVEIHIEEHGHLPEIPSEKQVLEEGVNIIEMQVKLLQKIEELTLYTIEQDKRIRELELKLKD